MRRSGWVCLLLLGWSVWFVPIAAQQTPIQDAVKLLDAAVAALKSALVTPPPPVDPPPPPPVERCTDKTASNVGQPLPCVYPPPPSQTVSVSNTAGLVAAVPKLQSNQTLVLAAGTYLLAGQLALPQGLTHVTIKGASGNRDDVTIRGAGMSGNVTVGIWVGAVSDLTVQDLTLRDFSQHGILINEGAQNPTVRNVRFVDIGDQPFKVAPRGVNGVVVEHSRFEYTNGAPDGYANAVDIHNGQGAIIRGNTFLNFWSTAGAVGPCVLVWNASRDTRVEGNTFTDCDRAITLGLDPNKPGTEPVNTPSLTDHAGGIITKNVIRRTRPGGDVPIMVADSPQTVVSFNDVQRGPSTYPNAIEVRWPRTTGVKVEDNVVAGAIVSRDGATFTQARNTTPGTPTPPPPPPPPPGETLCKDPKATNNGGALPCVYPPPVSGRRLTSADLVRVGSFKVPAGGNFEYGGGALGYNPTRNSLFLSGHDQGVTVGEISIPAIGATATLLSAASSFGGGVGSQTTKVGGTLVYLTQLLMTKYLFYDASNEQTASHFVRAVAGGTVTGPTRVGSLGAGYYSGYMGLVPSEWQARLGGAVLTGNCCLSIISRTSYGPAAFAIDPTNLPNSAKPLVYYTQQNQTLGTYGASGSHPVFNGSTRVRGIVFPDNTNSVLFIGTTGIGNYCYGEAAACGDSSNNSKGEHAYPYRAYVWGYDANDLAAVRAGTRQPWSVTPYATWELAGLTTGYDRVGGAAWDPKTRRLYISVRNADGERPLVYVFDVK